MQEDSYFCTTNSKHLLSCPWTLITDAAPHNSSNFHRATARQILFNFCAGFTVLSNKKTESSKFHKRSYTSSVKEITLPKMSGSFFKPIFLNISNMPERRTFAVDGGSSPKSSSASCSENVSFSPREFDFAIEKRRTGVLLRRPASLASPLSKREEELKSNGDVLTAIIFDASRWYLDASCYVSQNVERVLFTASSRNRFMWWKIRIEIT